MRRTKFVGSRTKFVGRGIQTIALAAVVIMLGAGLALADNVVDDIESSPPQKTITPGSSTDVKYWIVANGTGGLSGCDASDGSSVTVTPNVPAGVTATPASRSFNACGNATTNTQTITYSSSTPGTYSITVSASDSTGNYNTNPAAFSLIVSAPANTAPSVSVTGVTDGATYYKSSVPTPGCSVTDAEDSDESATPQVSNPPSDSLGSHTVTCSYTDGGGLSDSDTATYTVVRDPDTTPPVIDYQVSGTQGNNGWYTSNVSVSWTVTENESPETLNTSGCQDQNITSDQQSTDYSCSADSEGGSTGPVTVSIKRDATNPTNISFTGGGIADGGSYYFGSVPAGPTGCSADDATSGLASCTVTGGGETVGSHSYTATATDNAGNQATATVNYTVLAWTLKGFYPPVDMGGVWNTVKGGSTVPLKFEVFAGSNELTATSVVDSFTVKGVACPSGSAATDDIELVTTGGTSLRYDSTAGQFIQNWQTPKKAGACYTVTMTTDDGSKISANFIVK
jgi:hypothetical protein